MTPGLIVNYCPSIATRLGSNSFIAYSFVRQDLTTENTKHIHNLPQQMIFCIRRCILDFRYLYFTLSFKFLKC